MPRFFCQSNRLSFETGYIAPTPNPANPGSDISQLAPTYEVSNNICEDYHQQTQQTQ